MSVQIALPYNALCTEDKKDEVDVSSADGDSENETDEDDDDMYDEYDRYKNCYPMNFISGI